MKQNIFYVFLFSIVTMSCNPSMSDAYEELAQWNKINGWYHIVDENISQYNFTHDSTLLYSTLLYLDSIPQNNDNKVALLNRRLTVLRLLHKYDMVFAILDTCSEKSTGVFGKTAEYMITEISQYNYCYQHEKRNQKINELVCYMDYCFERHEMVSKENEIGYLQKYRDNQLALNAIAVKKEFITLNWYIVAKLLRGDKKTDIKLIIENYYNTYYINDEIEKEWLLGLLNVNYEEKDFDVLL